MLDAPRLLNSCISAAVRPREGCPRLLGTDWGETGCPTCFIHQGGLLFTPNMGRIHTSLNWCIRLALLCLWHCAQLRERRGADATFACLTAHSVGGGECADSSAEQWHCSVRPRRCAQASRRRINFLIHFWRICHHNKPSQTQSKLSVCCALWSELVAAAVTRLW